MPKWLSSRCCDLVAPVIILRHTNLTDTAQVTELAADAPVTAAGAADASGTGTEAAAVLDMDEIDGADETGEVNKAGGPAGKAPGEVGLEAMLRGIGGGDLSGAMTACSGVAAEAATEAEEVQAAKVARVEGTATVAEAVQAAKEAIEVAARAAKVGGATTAVLAPTEATNPPPAGAVPPVAATGGRHGCCVTTTETIDTASRAPAQPAAAPAAAHPPACSAMPGMGPSMVPAMVPAAMAAQLAALPGGWPYALGSNSDACHLHLALTLYY